MNDCLSRTYTCRNQCGMGGISGKFIGDHEKYQCPRAKVPCSSGCGKHIARDDLPGSMEQ
jgi:hypothetical protein